MKLALANINDIYNTIPHDDPATWDLLGEGKTIGIFQLEQSLGRCFSKKLKPENIHHLAALTAILRPGTLNFRDEDGVSMTEHYIRRKNGIEEVKYLHPLLESILKDTFGVMIYQEQMMAISVELAGFNLVEVDRLRKAAGKKDAKEMSAVCELFIEKAAALGKVTKEEAKFIIDGIKESARYLFNAAHAYAYAEIAYVSAYLKANHRLHFYKSWLRNAQDGPDSQDKIDELVEDCKYYNIEVLPPCILRSKINFEIEGESIRFGLSNIKGVGDAQVTKAFEAIRAAETRLGKNISEFTINEVLLCLEIPLGTLKKFIEAGAFSWVTPKRKKLLHYVVNLAELPDKPREWCLERATKYNNILTLLKDAAKTKKEGGACHDKRGVSKINSIIEILKNPPTDLVDYPDEIANMEEDLLGVALTCSRLDKFDNMEPDTTIQDFLKGKRADYMCFVIDLRGSRCYTMKKGKAIGREMARLNVKDTTGSYDNVIVWADELDKLREKDLLYEGAKLLIQCKYDSKFDSLVLERARKLVK
jgi:DNA polymerase III alpha subunit